MTLKIKKDYTPSCVSCGSVYDLWCCQVWDDEPNTPTYEAWYCNDCLDVGEDSGEWEVLE